MFTIPFHKTKSRWHDRPIGYLGKHIKFQCTCPFLFGIPVVFITCLLFQASESMASSVGLFRCTPHFLSGYAPLYSHFMCHK